MSTEHAAGSVSCSEVHPGLAHFEWAFMGDEERQRLSEGAAPRGNAERAEGLLHKVDCLLLDSDPDHDGNCPTAAPRAEGLDVERLARELAWASEETRQRLLVNVEWRDHTADEAWARLTDFQREQWTGRAARLSRPSDEECNRFRHDEHCAHLHES